MMFYKNLKYWLSGISAERSIRPGDIYEDCNYHPVICIENDRGDLLGISMIDGSGPRGCSMFHCGVVKLSIKKATEIKQNWSDEYVDRMHSYWQGGTNGSPTMG